MGARRRALLLALALLAVAALVAVRFPYRRLLPPLLAAASAATGAEIAVGDVGVGLGLAGPRLEAEDLRLAWPGANSLHLAAVTVRPAWSLAWLAGSPRWHVEATADAGGFSGVVAGDRLDGALREVQMDALPWAALGSTAPLHGRVSGTLDLARENGGWQGSASLHGTGGSVDLPGLPVAIPYEALAAELAVAPEALTLAAGRIEGPLVTASVLGTARADGASYASWPLDLDVDIEAVDSGLRGYLAPLGISVSPDGRARVKVTGSLGAPYLSGTPQ